MFFIKSFTALVFSNFRGMMLCIQVQPMLWRGVCPSVTFMYYIETNKRILKLFQLLLAPPF